VLTVQLGAPAQSPAMSRSEFCRLPPNFWNDFPDTVEGVKLADAAVDEWMASDTGKAWLAIESGIIDIANRLGAGRWHEAMDIYFSEADGRSEQA
jgi:hypothetical protein